MGRLLSAMTVAVAMLVMAAPVLAGPIDDYRKNGSINPCKYSDGQLKKGLKDLPPDVQQYAPGLTDQLNAGREGCNSGGSQQTQAVPAPGKPGNGGGAGGGGARGGAGNGAAGAAGAGGFAATGAAGSGATVPPPPSPVPASRRRIAGAVAPPVSARANQGAPGWINVVVLVLLAIAAVVAVLRFTGASAERLTRPLGAAFSEAGTRTSDSMAQLWDRVRLGR